MSDQDNFLTRWSRRKRAVAEESAQERSDAPPAESTYIATPPSAEPPELPFDISKLPPIETITAETDIRAFFAPGVPAELTRAALRRAWVADPMVRDFVGLNDYDFDFHTPGAIPGFGPLEMTDELRREVARIVGGLVAPDEPAPSAAPSASAPPAPAAQPPEAIEQINAPSLPPAESQEPATSSWSEHPAPAEEKEPSIAVRHERADDLAASQQEVPAKENLQIPARRGHGRALPE